MSPAPFVLVGGGWRAEFFARVAHALPERFRLAGTVLRDPAKREVWERRWGGRTHAALDDVDTGDAAFAVVSVSQAAVPDVIAAAHDRGLPVLAETPPAPDPGGLDRLTSLAADGATIEVAEQYPFQPHHAARLAVCRSGRLGEVRFAQVSEAHDYHGICLIRRYLGVGFEDATITARAFETPVVAGPDRAGPPARERIVPVRRVIAHLDFGNQRMGVYDFCGEQYFSWIRSRSTLVQGTHGELRDNAVRYLLDAGTPGRFDLRRDDAGEEGNLEGPWHRGYLAGDAWIYRNPFPGVPLSDDEIAVATCLDRMVRRVERGEASYDVAQAAQDQYLALCIRQALQEDEPVRTRRQSWAPAPAAVGG